MPIDEDLFSQNIGDLERDKFKASKDDATAVRIDGRATLQSEDGTQAVDLTDNAIATYDNNSFSVLNEILHQLKIMNLHLAEITGEEALNGVDT